VDAATFKYGVGGVDHNEDVGRRTGPAANNNTIKRLYNRNSTSIKKSPIFARLYGGFFICARYGGHED